MAKKKKKSAKAKAFTVATLTTGKSKQELVQEVYDDELKSAVKKYIENTVVRPTIGGKPLVPQEVFRTTLKLLRDTQAEVLKLLEEQ